MIILKTIPLKGRMKVNKNFQFCCFLPKRLCFCIKIIISQQQQKNWIIRIKAFFAYSAPSFNNKGRTATDSHCGYMISIRSGCLFKLNSKLLFKVITSYQKLERNSNYFVTFTSLKHFFTMLSSAFEIITLMTRTISTERN